MTLKLGLWGARADRSGLAIQSEEFVRHMKPVKVMGFDASRGPGEPNKERPSDWSGFDDPCELETDDDFWSLTEERAKAWLQGLDVVWGVETFYQDPFARWAKEMGVATVQHCNPEFFRFPRDPGVAIPTLICVPTTWRLEIMRAEIAKMRADACVELLPTPVATDRLPWTKRPLTADRLRFLHVVGRQAAEDRNGTAILARALEHVNERCQVVIASQSPIDRSLRWEASPYVEVILQTEVSDYAKLYEGCDVLVLPRRYGGQCLPMQEALASGMPVVMPDIEPQNGALPPDCLVDADRTGTFETQGGTIALFDVADRDLAYTMDYLSTHRARVAELSERTKLYREGMSWERLKQEYERTIVRAYERFHAE